MSARWRSTPPGTSLPERSAASSARLDNGETWAPVNDGLEYPLVISLAINSERAHLRRHVQGRRRLPLHGQRRELDAGRRRPDELLRDRAGDQRRPETSSPEPGAGESSAPSTTGDSWTAVNEGLTEPFVFSLTINSSGHLFAGTDFGSGVFRSTDNGDNLGAGQRRPETAHGVNALSDRRAGRSSPASTATVSSARPTTARAGTQVNDGLTATFVLSFTTDASGDVFAGHVFRRRCLPFERRRRELERAERRPDRDRSADALRPSRTVTSLPGPTASGCSGRPTAVRAGSRRTTVSPRAT